jgi:putative ABC transport system permease protein
MGLANPVGRWLSVNGRKGIIIGVVKDFNFGSLHSLIAPRIIGYGGRAVGVRFRPGKTAEVLAFLKSLNDRFLPNTPFQYGLIEDTIQRWYAVERRAGALFRGFTVLTIAIACLGLLGLASFMAERRTKEIGIRKVLGASVAGILWLQSRQLLSWVLLANAFAWPVGYLFARSWIMSFAYRVDLKIGLFLFSAGLALVLTLATVAFQSLRAAKADPVKCLRYE